MSETLGALIKSLRIAQLPDQLTQTELAKKVGKTKQWLGPIEMDNAAPSLEMLMALWKELGSEESPDFGEWLLKWLKLKIDTELGGDKEALKAIYRFKAQSDLETKSKMSGSQVLTLEDFPYGFENLMIVCGDRREMPPKRKSDLFVDAFSSCDLSSLKTLLQRTGPLDIKSDKIFVSGNESHAEYLKQTYGHNNLIVIGSPAVNLMARAINRNCVFRFSTTKEMRQFLKCWEDEFPEINDRKLRDIFWEMASTWPDSKQVEAEHYYKEAERRGFRIQPGQIEELQRKVNKLLGERTARYYKNSFHRLGFIDPIANVEQAFFLMDDNDFGVVSLCPNPFADEKNAGNYFCILAAGIHGPGTDMAVRLLANASENFKNHQLGGVIEVKLDLEARWSEKFQTAGFKWQTADYTVNEALVKKLANPPRGSLLSRCEPEELQRLVKFVKRFVPTKAQPAAAS